MYQEDGEYFLIYFSNISSDKLSEEFHSGSINPWP